MPYELPALPYAYDALEPHIDTRTMEIHHTKHHQAYIDNANKALAGTEFDGLPVEELVQKLDSLPADKKGVLQISTEMNELAKKARDGKLGPADMSGGCFSISSLGGIGGRYFTPIINAPEVSIMGVCRSSTEPRWDGKAFAPRLILPLSLSWDHRVIDGAAAARFNAYFAQILADFRRVLL